MKDSIKIKGVFEIVHKRKGKVIRKETIPNLITNAGLAGQASRLNGSGGQATFRYLALGTGTTSPTVANTALQAEITDSGLNRSLATTSRATTNVTNDTAVLTKQFTATGSKAVTELGALSASSGGTLLGRQVFSPYNIVPTDTLTITYKFIIS